MSSLYERMRSSSSNQSKGKRTYSFQESRQEEKPKSSGRFRSRTSAPKEQTEINRFSPPRNGTSNRKPTRETNDYIDDTDRPYAYGPPVIHQEQEIYRPPGVGSILQDLGLRMLEVAIGAIASEIAYFFTRRRFYGRRQDR